MGALSNWPRNRLLAGRVQERADQLESSSTLKGLCTTASALSCFAMARYSDLPISRRATSR